MQNSEIFYIDKFITRQFTLEPVGAKMIHIGKFVSRPCTLEHGSFKQTEEIVLSAIMSYA